MARWSLRLCCLSWTLALGLLGCDEQSPLQRASKSCPAGYQTCDGADDCVSSCVCGGDALASCKASCKAQGGPYVGQLDESAWVDDWAAFEDRVLSLTNQQRAKGGCCGGEGCFDPSSPLSFNERLRRSARSHAQDMGEQQYFSHDSKDGRSPFDRMREAGYRGCAMGENIAAGQPTPESVMDDWIHSPGHCANILQPGFKEIGVGYFERSDGQPIWVQNFGG
jgi:uncharacterized protein YkwD